MAVDKCTHLQKTLKQLFPDSKLIALAKESSFVVRARKIKPVAFFWTLVLGFAAGSERTVSFLRRAYQRVTSSTLAPSAFYDRFNFRLVRFLKLAIGTVLDSFQAAWTELDDRLQVFRDIVLVDATVIKLHDFLKDAFPGTRPKSRPAAAKLHLVLSVCGKGNSTVAVSSERVGDLKKLRIGPWVAGRLLLFDLGYFKYQLFSCIKRNGGFFLTRLKQKTNPTITKVLHPVRGKSIHLEGLKLQDVLKSLRRQVLDVEVEVSFEKRVYRGKRKTGKTSLRLVAVKDKESGSYHTYITNIPADTLYAQELARLYRIRWEIELLFKELRSGYRLDHLPSRKKEIVEALVYSTVLTLVASRALLRYLVGQLPVQSYRATAGRWWKLLSIYAQELLLLILRPPKEAQAFRGLYKTFFRELVDPHTNRKPLLAQAHF